MIRWHTLNTRKLLIQYENKLLEFNIWMKFNTTELANLLKLILKLRNLPDIRLNDMYLDPNDKPMWNCQGALFLMDNNDDKLWGKRMFIYGDIIIEKELNLNRKFKDVSQT
jgi:hypothetical protein